MSANEVTQNVVDEAEFAGTQASDNQDRALRLQRSEQKNKNLSVISLKIKRVKKRKFL